MTYENNILLDAIAGKQVSRPPVWMMRQAGRYLPEYQVLRKKYDFFTRVETPELAAEITIQPIDIVGVDAAILFSDILTVPKAMSVEVQMVKGIGPVLPDKIESLSDVEKLQSGDAAIQDLHYVFNAMAETKKQLNNRVPLIGFAGSPWTIFCYMIQGQGSKNFAKAKELCFRNPKTAHALLQKITDITIGYLNEQIKNGADLVQLFDSWGGLWSPSDYETYSLQYLRQIVEAINTAPVILYGKGCWFAYKEMMNTGASVIGVDWTVSPKVARELTGGNTVLQGNFDPLRLLSPPEEIEKLAIEMIDDFGVQNYIANLGHGIVPNIPVENAKAFVNAVKNYGA